jgi:hypothetical protein
VLATFAEDDPNLVTFKNRLQELGWTEAKLRIATRVAEDGQRTRTAASELVTYAVLTITNLNMKSPVATKDEPRIILYSHYGATNQRIRKWAIFFDGLWQKWRTSRSGARVRYAR